MKGKKIGFVNYNQFSPDAENRALSDITHLRSVVDVLFVYTQAIYYSLGNFVFDQYFSAETKHGLMVEASLAFDSTLSFREIPIELSSDGKTRVKK